MTKQSVNAKRMLPFVGMAAASQYDEARFRWN